MVLGSVRIENITHCSIYLGPVSTSVYIEQAEHCVLHFACHQLRIHNCLHTQLYIHPRSHPIIEDCKEMGFAPYILTYRGLSEQMEVRGTKQPQVSGRNHFLCLLGCRASQYRLTLGQSSGLSMAQEYSVAQLACHCIKRTPASTYHCLRWLCRCGMHSCGWWRG